MFHAHAIFALTLRPLANVLIWTMFAAVTVVILAALTGIFVMWLLWVGLLIAAIVMTDLVHRCRRRLSGSPARILRQRPIG